MREERTFKIAAVIGVILAAIVIGTCIFLFNEDRELSASANLQDSQQSARADSSGEAAFEAAGSDGETADVGIETASENTAETTAVTAEEALGSAGATEEEAAEDTAAAAASAQAEEMEADASGSEEIDSTDNSGGVQDEYDDKPDIDVNGWQFILANPWNEIGDYAPELVTIEGQEFDVRIADALNEFVAAARAEGLSVFLSSGYRSYETQEYLFNRKAAQYGEEIAATIVARPGTSEHQTGLSCDITDRYYELKDSSLEDTALYQWMSQHCQEYGFIVRYPKDRQDVTGIIYEPWHFRYVGVEAASYIMENDLTLEEFLWMYDTAEGDAENR